MNVIPTVIIPIIYNEKIDWYWDKAKDAIESVIHQTVKPELIVSVDLTHAKAKNAGVEKANTEWCMFLDADDALNHEFIENLEVENEWVGLLKPTCLLNGVELTLPVANLFAQNFLINACVFKRDIYLDVGGSEDRPFPDWYLWAKMFTEYDMEVQEVDSIYHYRKTNVGLNAHNSPDDWKQTQEDIKNYYRKVFGEDGDRLVPKMTERKTDELIEEVRSDDQAD